MTKGDISECWNSFLFPNVFKTFRMAIQPSRLLTAFTAVFLLFIVGWLMNLNKSVVVSGNVKKEQFRVSALSGSLVYPSELHCYINSPERVGDFIKKYKGKNDGAGVSSVLGNYCLGRFNDAAVGVIQFRFDRVVESVIGCVAAFSWAMNYHTIYSIIMFLVTLALLSIFGGAICRGTALQFARGEKLSVGEGLYFGLRKFVSLSCAPLAPIVLSVILGLCIFLLGLVANIPWAGEIILAVLILFVLLAGVLMTFAIIGSVAGSGLMFPAIAYENSDTFDAISRSFSYVFSRPWRLGFYSFVAMSYGAICYLFVRFFAFVLLAVSRWFLGLGVWVNGSKSEQLNKVAAVWPRPEFFNLLGSGLDVSKNTTESIAAFVIYIAILIIAGLVAAFVLSFYFSANTIIYSLLRQKNDGTELNEICLETEDITEDIEGNNEPNQEQKNEQNEQSSEIQ